MNKPVSRTGNLPATFTSFVGRQSEAARVTSLLRAARLLTLTGAGGVGKTRLALEAAAGSATVFPDGVWLVDLTPVHEPAAVADTAATALQVPDLSTRSATQELERYLVDRRALIVLDNCEHLVDACAELAKALLSAAPELCILATSRHTLGITGEHVFTVPPLSPEDAAELLRGRATAVLPDFRLDDANRAHVSQLCADVDGLPLAIELAASRLRTLTVQQVVERLEDRFTLLTRGSATRQPHQRTLRGMIDWSYELCAPAERLLWNRLSVFAGGFDLESAEAVCTEEGIAEHEVVDLLDRLVVQSVVLTTRTEGIPRYRLLETIRQYGRVRLSDSGEEERLVLRHRDFFLALSQRIDKGWYGPGQADALARLRVEHPNLLTALECDADPQARLALAAALRFHWYAGGFLDEGRRQLQRALTAAPDPTPVRARALLVAAWLAQTQGDLTAADLWQNEADALGEQLGDPVVRAEVRGSRGVSAQYRGRTEEAMSRYEEVAGDLAALGDRSGAAGWRLALACAQAYARDPRAAETGREVIAAAEASGERLGRGTVLTTLGLNAWERGDREAAKVLARSGLDSARGFNDYPGVAIKLEVLAWATGSGGDHRGASRLMGAADALWREAGTAITAFDPRLAEHHARCEEAALGALGKRAYAKAFAEGGRHDSPGRAIRYALDPSPDPAVPAADPSPLTAREREVAALVARGLSNRKIAAELVISPRTVDAHVEHIRTKLDCASRAKVAAWWAAQAAPDI